MLFTLVAWIRNNHKSIATGVGAVAGVVCPMTGEGMAPCVLVGKAIVWGLEKIGGS